LPPSPRCRLCGVQAQTSTLIFKGAVELGGVSDLKRSLDSLGLVEACLWLR